MQHLIRFSFVIGIAISVFVGNGCEKRHPPVTAKPFQSQELDASLAILIDVSGSFADSWDQKAYPLFISLMDQYFTAGMGEQSRVVIGQISGSEEVVLFDGSPNDLLRKFKSPAALAEFLRDHSDPFRSRVYHSTQNVVDYMRQMSGITDQTRIMTVVLSDMKDSEQDVQKFKELGRSMLASLSTYREQGGTMALYCVDPGEVERWELIFEQAGFETGDYLIETRIVENPQLPRYE